MPFKPGKSGNPGGRPATLAAMQELARTHTEAAIEALVLALADDKQRVAAASVLLDRAWGKPAQAITGADGKPLFPRITVLFGDGPEESG